MLRAHGSTLDFNPQTLAEEFNSCVATTGSDQRTFDISKVKQGTSEYINDLLNFIDQFSIAAVALAGTWGELISGCGLAAGRRCSVPSLESTL